MLEMREKGGDIRDGSVSSVILMLRVWSSEELWMGVREKRWKANIFLTYARTCTSSKGCLCAHKITTS